MQQSSRARADLATAQFIAGFIGPIAFVIGLSMLLNRSLLERLADEISRDIALIFVSGVLSLIVGIAIVRAHNVWRRDWQVLVTVLGWLFVAGGLARMLASDEVARLAPEVAAIPNVSMFAGLALAAFGTFLSIKAYGRQP